MEIIKGKQKQPFNVILFGTPGVGKSTWASKSPKPIFLGFEETSELEVDRFQIPKSYAEFVNQLDHLAQSTADYKTVVIDSIDTVERALHQQIREKEDGKPLAKCMGGYAAAYDYAESRLKIDVKDKLKFLRDVKGMNVILLGHVMTKTKTDPIQALTYDAHQPNLHHKAQSLFVDWAQCCFFATYVTSPVKDGNSDKVFSHSSGKRKLLCEERPGVYAKNRYNLPYEMPFEFDVFFERYEAFYAGKELSQDELRASITALLESKDDALKAKAVMATEKAGNDQKKLKDILERLRSV